MWDWRTDSINFARAGAILTVVELSEKSLEICKKRFEIFELTATFYLGNSEELSSFLPMQKFDLIYSFGVIHHTVNPSRIIKQLKKYMDEGAELKIMMYSKFSYKMFWLMKDVWDFSKIDTIMTKNAEAQYGCPIAYTYTFEELRELLGDDFEIVDIHKDHIFPYKIDLYKEHKYELEDCFVNMDKMEF